VKPKQNKSYPALLFKLEDKSYHLRMYEDGRDRDEDFDEYMTVRFGDKKLADDDFPPLYCTARRTAKTWQIRMGRKSLTIEDNVLAQAQNTNIGDLIKRGEAA
jgi:hypothetical protein